LVFLCVILFDLWLAVYIYELDYVTSPYYRWNDAHIHGGGTGAWGGYPTTSYEHTHCDEDGENCVLATGFCTDTNVSPLSRVRVCVCACVGVRVDVCVCVCVFRRIR